MVKSISKGHSLLLDSFFSQPIWGQSLWQLRVNFMTQCLHHMPRSVILGIRMALVQGTSFWNWKLHYRCHNCSEYQSIFRWLCRFSHLDCTWPLFVHLLFHWQSLEHLSFSKWSVSFHTLLSCSLESVVVLDFFWLLMLSRLLPTFRSAPEIALC